MNPLSTPWRDQNHFTTRLIKTATVRRPQLGIGESEKTQLLDSYRALTKNEFRSVEKGIAAKHIQAAG